MWGFASIVTACCFARPMTLLNPNLHKNTKAVQV